MGQGGFELHVGGSEGSSMQIVLYASSNKDKIAQNDSTSLLIFFFLSLIIMLFN